MSKVMVTIRGPVTPPTVTDVRDRFGLSEDEIDDTFGVVEVDPDEHVYSVLVEDTAVEKLQSNHEWHTAGPYSNPRIEPFGPPD